MQMLDVSCNCYFYSPKVPNELEQRLFFSRKADIDSQNAYIDMMRQVVVSDGTLNMNQTINIK